MTQTRQSGAWAGIRSGYFSKKIRSLSNSGFSVTLCITHDTERVETAVMLWPPIQNMFRSNLSQAPAIPIGDFHGFPKSLQQKAGIVPRIDHDDFLQNPFQFISHTTRRYKINDVVKKAAIRHTS
jgi:hypothetical protein